MNCAFLIDRGALQDSCFYNFCQIYLLDPVGRRQSDRGCKQLIIHDYLKDNLRNTGFILAVLATTISVMIPPNATDGTKPISLAVIPDSKAPSSFDEPIKILFTEATRPRICSGV